MRSVLTCALVLALVSGAAAATLTLSPTKDARVLGHRSEVNQNCGKSTRLRMVGIARGTAEFVIMDFDRAQLKEFVETHKEKTLSGKLMLNVREVQGGEKIKVEVATIDCGVDWAEGTGVQTKAKKGESCALAAQFEVKKWAKPDGTEVERFKPLVYDGKEVTTVLNSKGVEVSQGDAGKYVEIELDEKLIKHLGTDANCRGLFLFHRDKQAKADIYSREQNRRAPKLVVTAK